jgi:hypothetical protein
MFQGMRVAWNAGSGSIISGRLVLRICIIVICGILVLWYYSEVAGGEGSFLCRLPTESPLPPDCVQVADTVLCILYFVTCSVLRTTCSPWRPAPSTDAREKKR